MYKLLIIEDERWEREGLLDFLDWNGLGIEIAGTASNGIEGIEMAQNICPEIIITDIKMPMMDGMEMSKKIKEFLPNTKIIILTGYDDFKYAKESISFNASAYILKPVEEEEMQEVIQKVIEECNYEKRRWDEEISLRMKLTENTLLIKKQKIIEYFEGKLSSGCLFEELGTFKFDCGRNNYVVAAIKPSIMMVTDEISVDSGKLGNLPECYRDIFNERKDLVIQQNIIILNSENENETLICMTSDRGQENILGSYIRQIAEIYRDNCKIDTVVGIGKNATGFDELTGSYLQAKQALAFGEFWNGCGVTCFSEVEDIQKAFAENVGGFLIRGNYFSKQLVHALRSSDEERVFELLEEFFEFITLCKGGGNDFISNYLYGIMNESLLVIFNMNKNIDYTEELDFGKHLPGLRSWQAIKEYILDFFQKVLLYLNDKKINKNEQIIKMVIQLVHGKYMNDINLKTVAGEVFLSPNYLGRIFKENTGKAFNDYLCEVRMEKAKELLNNSKNKVYWIAQVVGIDNVSYFCAIFKNTYGIAPGEYQERMIRADFLVKDKDIE
jgi:two-component system, response regulator YesN